MSTNHSHHHGHSHLNDSAINLKVAFFLNLLFTIIEIIGGFLTNSMAILSDALHDLGDSVSLGAGWVLEKYSKKAPDRKYSYGYSRFSLLGALINSIILVAGSVLLLVQIIPRIITPVRVNSKGMLILAILGIILNGAAVVRVKKGQSLNEKTTAWHLIEDVLGWIAILIASIIMQFVDAPILDPLISLGITIFVLFHVIRHIKSILRIFLEGVPNEYSIDLIEQELLKNPQILHIHHTHLWSLEGENILLSTHLVVRDELGSKEVVKLKKNIKELLSKKGINHATIEIDYEFENCESKC